MQHVKTKLPSACSQSFLPLGIPKMKYAVSRLSYWSRKLPLILCILCSHITLIGRAACNLHPKSDVFRSISQKRHASTFYIFMPKSAESCEQIPDELFSLVKDATFVEGARMTSGFRGAQVGAQRQSRYIQIFQAFQICIFNQCV